MKECLKNRIKQFNNIKYVKDNSKRIIKQTIMTGRQENIIVELLEKILHELRHQRVKFRGPVKTKKY